MNKIKIFEMIQKRNHILLIAFLLSLCFRTVEAQIFPQEKWQEVIPETQGVDTRQLENALMFLQNNSGSDGTEQVVIIRNGYLIYKGDKAGEIHGVWSMTKSFTSTVFGILLDENKCFLESKADTILSVLREKYPSLLICHFANMTSGYLAIGDEPQGNYLHGPSRTPFEPSEPLFSPGEKFAYWDSAMNMFALLLTRIAGISLDSLFQDRIATPIGINTTAWEWSDLGIRNGLRINCGAGNHGMVKISALDIARLGYLFLRNGNWNGKQIISTEWVRKATSVQVGSNIPLGGVSKYGPGQYGYNWWVNATNADMKRKWPGAPSNTFSASGYNNNDMFVIPEWNMVVVRLGLDQAEKLITDDVYSQFLELIGKSILKN